MEAAYKNKSIQSEKHLLPSQKFRRHFSLLVSLFYKIYVLSVASVARQLIKTINKPKENIAYYHQ